AAGAARRGRGPRAGPPPPRAPGARAGGVRPPRPAGRDGGGGPPPPPTGGGDEPTSGSARTADPGLLEHRGRHADLAPRLVGDATALAVRLRRCDEVLLDL